MDLSLRFDEHAREEQCEPAYGQNSGGDELYDSFFHNFYILHFGDIFIAIPFTFHLSFFTFHFSISGAKVQQKNEATKKVTSLDRGFLGFSQSWVKS